MSDENSGLPPELAEELAKRPLFGPLAELAALCAHDVPADAPIAGAATVVVYLGPPPAEVTVVHFKADPRLLAGGLSGDVLRTMARALLALAVDEDRKRDT
jgi:hypothetical protein